MIGNSTAGSSAFFLMAAVVRILIDYGLTASGETCTMICIVLLYLEMVRIVTFYGNILIWVCLTVTGISLG